jgi:hypothetical protein
MVWCRLKGRVAALCLLVSFDTLLVSPASALEVQRNGSLSVAGRSLRCGSMRNVLDPRLPNLGLAAPGVLVLNPRLLNGQSNTVRLFVYHHECGHHYVGGSETGADCWAVRQGVRQGWLREQDLGQVCRSFGNGPATATHPSGASRCASLQRCFANATATQARRLRQSAAPPKLVSGPTLVRSSKERSQE